MDTLFSLYTNNLACRAPAKNYALFLMERYLQLKIKVVKAGAPIKINTIDDFINCCKHYGVKVQILLCEFYLHNLVLDQKIEQNPNPFVRDIQLQAFISIGINQIKWLKAYNAFERQENGLDLWVRAEPRDPLQLWNKHRNLMRTPGMIKALGPIHTAINRQRIEYLFTIKDLAIATAKFRYQTSNPNIQLREPFNYENFKLVVDRLGLYGDIILREGPSWLGCRF